LKKKENLNRQNMALNYTPNGCLYLFSKEHFVNNRKIYSPTSKSYAHIMPEPYSVEIDEPIDLEWANFLYESKLINFEFWS